MSLSEYARAVAGDGNGHVALAAAGSASWLMFVRLGGVDGPVQVAHNLAGITYTEGDPLVIAPTKEQAPTGWRVVGAPPCAGFAGVQVAYVTCAWQNEALVEPALTTPAVYSMQRLNDDGTYTLTDLKVNQSSQTGSPHMGLQESLTLGTRVYASYKGPGTDDGYVWVYDHDGSVDTIVAMPAPDTPVGINPRQHFGPTMAAGEDGTVYVLWGHSDGTYAPGQIAFLYKIAYATLTATWLQTLDGSPVLAGGGISVVGPPPASRPAYWIANYSVGGPYITGYAGDIYPPTALVNQFVSADDDFYGTPLLTATWCNRVTVVAQTRIYRATSTTLPYTLTLHAQIANNVALSDFAYFSFIWRHCWGNRIFGVIQYSDDNAPTGTNMNPFGAPTFIRPTKVGASYQTSVCMALVELFTDGSVQGIWGFQFYDYSIPEAPFNNCNGAGGANGYYYFAIQNTTADLELGVYQINLLTGTVTQVMGPSKFATGSPGNGTPVYIVTNGRYR